MKKINKLVFIPGMLSNHILWEKIIPRFEADYICEVVDVSSQNSVESMANTIIEQQPIPFHCVGFSLGGWITLQIAKTRPELLKSMTIVCSTGATLKADTRKSMSDLIVQLNQSNFQNHITQLYSRWVCEKNLTNNQLKQTMFSMMQNHGVQKTLRQLNALLNFDGHITNQELSKITTPTLIIQADEDLRVDPDEIKQLANALLNAKLTLISNAGHFLPLENPAALATVLHDFLLGDVKNKDS